MNKYRYSASENLRYLISLLPAYTDQNALPGDMIDISDAMAEEFFDNPTPVGKLRGADEDGLPCWIDAPAASHESLIAQAEYHRSILRDKAESEITWRQGAVDEGIATEKEAADLSAWIKYRVLLMRVDITSAPDIDWPPPPVS